MKVLKLFVKQSSDLDMVERQQLSLRRGYGIEGDKNACIGSPRQVLLVDQPSLDAFGLKPGDLWENILVDTTVANLESGRLLRIGSTLIRPTFLCEPCSWLDTRRKGLATQIKNRRGFLGMVVQSGMIAVGDPVTPTHDRLPRLPNDAKGRFYEIVARIPVGKVMTTADLILAMGVAHAYYRTIAILIKKAPAELPVHRIVAIDRSLFSRHMPDQESRLTAEGIELLAGKVKAGDRWQPEDFHPLSDDD